MKQQILLLGATGQIGYELKRSLISIGSVVCPDRTDWTASKTDSLDGIVATTKPTIIVNASAYTAVDQAESEPDLAEALNTAVPAKLAHLARQTDALLVDYSTDYVFNGQKNEPFSEDDATDPVNQYGVTKLGGLQAIQASDCRHLVFRVSWVYSSRRQNFLKTIVRLAQERDSLNVIDDQWGVPTSARWIAEMTSRAISQLNRNQGCEGVFNLSPDGKTNWYQFANEIVRMATEYGMPLKLKLSDLHPIDTSGYPTPAKRPTNSCLDHQKINREFGFEMPSWKCFVPLVIEELLNQ